MTLGVVVRADDGGLAWQSFALCRMLQPARVLIIDSRAFNGVGVKQHPERFAGYDSMITKGFPTDDQCHQFLDGLTHVLTCETPYNFELFAEAERRGIKTYLQQNHEFLRLPHWLRAPPADEVSGSFAMEAGRDVPPVR